MSALNQNNRREKIARVSILTTDGSSKIEVLHGNIKEIRVYISSNSRLPALQSYRQSLLQLFIHLTEGYKIPQLESSSDVSQDIVNLFIHVCAQIDNDTSIQNITDDTGRFIINSQSRVTVFASENRLVAETDERLPVQRTLQQDVEAQRLAIQQFDRDMENQRLEAQRLERQRLESQQQEAKRQEELRQQTIRRQQQETVRRGINELFGLLRPDGGNDEQVGQVLTEVGQILSGNAPQDQVRATANRRRQNSGLSTPLFPVVRDLPFPLNILSAIPNQSNQSNQSNQQNQPNEDSPFLEPLVRNLNDPQSIQPNNHQVRSIQSVQPTQPTQPTQSIQSIPSIQPIQPIRRQDESEESEIPNRFVENHSGARREIFPDEKNIISAEPTPIANTSTEPVVHPTHIPPVRNPVPLDIIQKIASNTFDLIKSGKTRPPDFKLKTKSGLTRIKNYIHNISRVWLSHDEIELFITELTKLQSST